MVSHQDSLDSHFATFRKHIIGEKQLFRSPYGWKPIYYFDWMASGRLYRPIEETMIDTFGPYVANTHTEANVTGTFMTRSYREAIDTIKKHVHASEEDRLIFDGTGMTGVMRRLQRMLGLVVDERYRSRIFVPQQERPVVFITHMEHHSNHTSWLETIAEVVVIPPNSVGNVDLDQLEQLANRYQGRPLIASVTACSNVTGIITPYYEIARIIHRYHGICIVDFSASAPYVEMNMHPDPETSLDAIVFSPHKFLGGPGTTGVCIFHQSLYNRWVPDKPGGGTVLWTNPWKGRRYIDEIEEREDGGTPGFLQAIRIALAMQLKEKMNVELIQMQENRLISYLLPRLQQIPKVKILGNLTLDRLGVISFYVEDVHHQLLTLLFNDHYGIQVRGGCSCAGTYGHYLLGIDRRKSKQITDEIDRGNLKVKPGWVRMSLHPTHTIADLDYFLFALNDLVHHIDQYQQDYMYDEEKQTFIHHFFAYEMENLPF